MSTGTINTHVYTKRKWTDDQLRQAVRQNSCLNDTLRTLGLSVFQVNAKSVKRHIQRLNISTTHWNKSKALLRKSLYISTKEEAIKRITSAPQISRPNLRRLVKKFNIVPYACFSCQNTGHWKSKSLVLELDHKNGRSSDNRPSNLRFACPNCHSQTPTFRGRNKK